MRKEAMGLEEGDQGHQGGPEEVGGHEEGLAVLGVGPGGKQRGKDHGAEELGAQHQGDPEDVSREEVDQDQKGHPEKAGFRRTFILPFWGDYSQKSDQNIGHPPPLPGQEEGALGEAVDQEVLKPPGHLPCLAHVDHLVPEA